jgi:hypothetical protein
MESIFAFGHSFIQMKATAILVRKSFLYELVTSILVLSANNIGIVFYLCCSVHFLNNNSM